MQVSSTNIIYVSPSGHDDADGSEWNPLKTIQAAASIAKPGNIVEVKAGLYREAISPIRGGNSDEERITFRAARGEDVEIRGSEEVSGWTKNEEGLWVTTIKNETFGDFNPFAEEIKGDWFKPLGRLHHVGSIYLNGEWLIEAGSLDEIGEMQYFAKVDSDKSYLYANFGEVDPNSALTEMNVRPFVFYPKETGLNYITVSGFTMSHAATNWAPPTAEQIGLIGTNWSKGWIIENNTISHSRCVGITLGKHGDEYDNCSEDSAIGYVDTIRRAEERGWSKENIGSHIVRNNHIHHCEQAGIVGSLGAIFSEVTHNHIHDIHIQKLFAGEEQAGIKFHAPIDTLIAHNRINNTCRALWMDWMSQGTRIHGNLCYNSEVEDLFVEVNHGPFVVDNNVFLSKVSMFNVSEGGAYVHNLFGGDLRPVSEFTRDTPYHKEHSTEIIDIVNIQGGDDRFINNLFASQSAFEKSIANLREAQLEPKVKPKKDGAEIKPCLSDGNSFLDDSYIIKVTDSKIFIHHETKLEKCSTVEGKDLGINATVNAPYKNYDSGSLHFNQDYRGECRDVDNVIPGPFIGSLPKYLELL